MGVSWKASRFPGRPWPPPSPFVTLEAPDEAYKVLCETSLFILL